MLVQLDTTERHYLGFKRGGPKCVRTIFGRQRIIYGQKEIEIIDPNEM